MLSLSEQKPFLAEHLPYELAMLEFTYQRLEALTVPSAEFNVFLEAFCIHARNLKWFLTRNSDGVRALDFVAGYSVRVDNLASVFNRINHNVSHIFRHRLNGKKFTLYDATLAYAWLKNEMEAFRKALSPPRKQCGALALADMIPALRIRSGLRLAPALEWMNSRWPLNYGSASARTRTYTLFRHARYSLDRIQGADVVAGPNVDRR